MASQSGRVILHSSPALSEDLTYISFEHGARHSNAQPSTLSSPRPPHNPLLINILHYQLDSVGMVRLRSRLLDPGPHPRSQTKAGVQSLLDVRIPVG